MMIIKKIDDYFYSKEKKDFYSMLAAIALGVGFIFFYFIYPQMNSFEGKAEKEYQKISKEVKDLKTDRRLKKLKSIRLENDEKSLKKELIVLKNKEDLYKNLVSLLDFAKFDRQKWSNFVKNIILFANKSMEVQLIENQVDTNSTGLISGKLEVGLRLKGNYIDFVNFIYHYEDMKELIRVNKIETNSTDDFYVKFILYGYGK